MSWGLQIIYSTSALEATKERRFPVSRHRSARVRKKLIKRFGSEFVMVPAMWKAGDKIYAHPSFKPQIDAATKSTDFNYLGPRNLFGASS